MANNKSVPSWVWVTTPAIAAAFIGFIWFLSTIPADPEVQQAKQQAGQVIKQQGQQVRKDAAAAAELAKVAKPTYDFYKLLEKQTVDVPDIEAYRSTPKDSVIDYDYLLQAGSFRSEEDADRMRANLLLEGLKAYTEGSDVNGSKWYRVYVGPFDNRSKLNKAQDQLVDMRINPLVLKQKKSG